MTVYFLADKYTPIKIIKAPINCTDVSISINIPEKLLPESNKSLKLQNRRRHLYKLEENNISNSVPTTPKIIINTTACCTFQPVFQKTSEV
jgi:hypothetical protein